MPSTVLCDSSAGKEGVLRCTHTHTQAASKDVQSVLQLNCTNNTTIGNTIFGNELARRDGWLFYPSESLQQLGAVHRYQWFASRGNPPK